MLCECYTRGINLFEAPISLAALGVCMTQDKCVYTVRIETEEKEQRVREVVAEPRSDDSFDAEVIDAETDADDRTVLTVEVHGDGYEIPVFEEVLTDAGGEIVEATVDVGGSKFSGE